jgi:hypothetical protein
VRLLNPVGVEKNVVEANISVFYISVFSSVNTISRRLF